MKRFVGLLGILIMVVIAFGKKSPYLEGGKVHYREGRYEKADSLFLVSIDKGLAVTESYMWHGKARIRINDQDDPIEAARAFLVVFERDTTGEILKKDEEALDLAQIAFYYGAQQIIYDSSKADTVIIFLRKGLQLDSTREQNYVLLGRFHLQNQNLDKALAIADELEKVSEESPDVPYLRGRAAMAKRNAEEAIENFSTSAERFNTELRVLKETVGKDLSLEDEVIDKMLAAMQEADDDASMEDKQNMLIEEFGLNPPPQAIAFLRWHDGYVGKKRQLSDAYNYLGKSYMQNEKYEESDSVLTIALELDPENINAMWDKVFACYYTKNYKEAVTILEALEAATEEDYFTHLWYGICYLNYEPKELDKAEEHLLKALEIAPDVPDIYRNLAVVAREQGDIKKSSELLKKYDELLKKEGDN